MIADWVLKMSAMCVLLQSFFSAKMLHRRAIIVCEDPVRNQISSPIAMVSARIPVIPVAAPRLVILVIVSVRFIIEFCGGLGQQGQ